MKIFEVVSDRMTFYHGTSSRVIPSIQQDGLTPQTDPQSAMRGNGSDIPGYTERMVFLSPLAREAVFYARAICQKIGGSPVILSVVLSSSDPLRVSDDYISDLVLHAIMSHQGHPKLSSDDFDEDGDLDVAYSEIANTYVELREFIFENRVAFWSGHLNQIVAPPEMKAALQVGYTAYQQALKHTWQASVTRSRDPALAFEGTIPPERITILSPQMLQQAARSLSRYGRGTV